MINVAHGAPDASSGASTSVVRVPHSFRSVGYLLMELSLPNNLGKLIQVDVPSGYDGHNLPQPRTS